MLSNFWKLQFSCVKRGTLIQKKKSSRESCKLWILNQKFKFPNSVSSHLERCYRCTTVYSRNVCALYNIRIWRKFAHICPSLYRCSEGTCSFATDRRGAELVCIQDTRCLTRKTKRTNRRLYFLKQRHAIVTCVLSRRQKKKMHTFKSCSEKISARWRRTHSNINIFMKALVCLLRTEMLF